MENLRSIHGKFTIAFPIMALLGVAALLGSSYYVFHYLLTKVLVLDPARTAVLLDHFLRYVQIAGGTSFLVIIFSVVYFRKWGILAQLDYIMKSVRRISEGKVTAVELRLGLSSELVDIGMSINSMMKRLAMSQSKLEQREVLLRNSKEDLEKRVEERTLELEANRRTLEEQKSELMMANSQLENQTSMLQEKNLRQQAFSEFLSYINSIDIETIIESTLLKLLEVCRYHFVVAYIYDEERDELYPVYQYAMDYGKIEREHFASSEGLPRKILDSNEWIKIDEFDDVSQPVIDLGVAQVKINNLYGIPLVFGQKKIGVLMLGGLQKTTEESLVFLRDCMGPLCSALSNALSYQFIQVQSDTLQNANTELEKASHLKDQFLANVSHEIRTPLNGIIGMTGLVMDTSLNSEQEEYLKIIKSSADSLLTLINDILDLSKIEAGQLELESLEMNIVDVVENVLDPIAFNKAKPGLEIYYEIHEDCPENVIGDPTRLRQILINLVGNAAKFTKEGEIVIHIDLEEVKGNQAKLHFKVRDTGIGIEKEALATIFESFVQADGSISRKYGGTGLGTTISKQLVEMMNGRIWLDSTFGVGTTFEFLIEVGLPPANRHFTNPLQPQHKQMAALIVGGVANWPGALSKRISSLGISTMNFQNPIELMGWLGGPGKMLSRELSTFFINKSVDEELDEGFLQNLIQNGFARERITILVHNTDKNCINRCREIGLSYITRPLKRQGLINQLIGRKTEAIMKGEECPDKLRVLSARLKILLAEDNLVNQKLACRLLEGPEIQIDVAGTGLEALKNYQEKEYDIVLMDVQMPEMGGLEATMKIREYEADKGKKRVPILAMTAHAMKGDRDKCIQAGMDDYVTKPIMPEQLYATIYKYLMNIIPSNANLNKMVPGSVQQQVVSDPASPFASGHFPRQQAQINDQSMYPAQHNEMKDLSMGQQSLAQNAMPSAGQNSPQAQSISPAQSQQAALQGEMIEVPSIQTTPLMDDPPPSSSSRNDLEPMNNLASGNFLEQQMVQPDPSGSLPPDLMAAMFRDAGIPVPQQSQQAQPAPEPKKESNREIDQSIFNYDQALHVANKDINFLIQLIDIYKEDFPNMLKGLKEALASKDPSQIEAQAHGIKSGIVNIGAEKVAQVALYMEQNAAQKNIEGLDSKVMELEREIQDFYLETEKLRYLV